MLDFFVVVWNLLLFFTEYRKYECLKECLITYLKLFNQYRAEGCFQYFTSKFDLKTLFIVVIQKF